MLTKRLYLPFGGPHLRKVKLLADDCSAGTLIYDDGSISTMDQRKISNGLIDGQC